MKTIAFLSLAAALLPSIAAKGYVSSITIDGTEYKGPSVGDDSGEFLPGSFAFSRRPRFALNLNILPELTLLPDAKFAIRSVNSADAIKGASNPDIACGPGSKAASEYATAKPGSKVEVQWVGSDGGAWEDKTGPLISYIALCPQMECRKLKATDAKWAKIDEVSIRDDKTWAQEDLANGNPATLTLPEGLAAGAYLLRHEIISLSNASTEGGADFYASCAQIKVEHGGDGAVSDGELVGFPGAYSDTDKGILLNYPYPGPPIAAMAKGSADSGPSSMALPPASTAPAKRDNLPASSSYWHPSPTKRATDPQCSTLTCDDPHHPPAKRDDDPAAAARRLHDVARKLVPADPSKCTQYPCSTVTVVPGKRRLPPGHHGF
ncbi:glycosyl hydrolase family 61-domain-containing protein [Schizophyllum commune]